MSYEFKAPLKDPASVLRHAFDWRGKGWLEVDETITSQTVTATPAGMTIDQVTESDGVVGYRIAGGVDGAQYTVTCQITTSGGRTDERSVLYKIGQR